ncbi:WS/DGAT/MGAT family O-acyltransferase [Tomitella gaofuii]|uniref:WS/DGAT/MGAT family O-acyltransferase n=1 Tax=Tomitella gaofuii TaxID=2760083 RepID=UPI0015FCF5BC|nr:wax ester/triacylglycerol synthase family O-acyltransferase [Tomitella gaofuii]
MRSPMPPTDAMFLMADTRYRPMHAGGVALFAPPDDAGAGTVSRRFSDAVDRGSAGPLWRRVPRRSVSSLGLWAWQSIDSIDLDYHVQRHGLPAPRGHTELTDLVARLHAAPLDRSRPMWEFHLIEGLADGRLAVYIKLHHALADGVTAVRLLCAALSPDPGRRGMRAPWEPAEPDQADRPLRLVTAVEPGRPRPLSGLLGAARTVAGETAGLPLAMARAVEGGVRRRGGPVALAPARTVFSGPIGGPRSFAAHNWMLERLRLVAKRADTTVGDVILAMCGGALRTYLSRRDALPGRAITAMVPVSLRAEAAGTGAGNKLGALACSLGTDIADPAARLTSVHTSMRRGKDMFAAHSPAQVLAMSGMGTAPLALGMLTGQHGVWRAPSVMISNIPGPAQPLYWNGARLDALYPVSVPVDGQALNITCTSTGNQIAFGLTACRKAVPDLHVLPDHLDSALSALESASHR